MQQDLFDGPPREPSPPSLPRVSPPDHPLPHPGIQRVLGEGEVRLGCSSWSFPGWRGLVYEGVHPESRLARHGLVAYSAHPLLRTVGVDRSYYRAMPASELKALSSAVPPDFRFLVKVPASVVSPVRRDGARTSGPNPGFLDPELALRDALVPFQEGLGALGGVLLFQFPPLRISRVERASLFLDRLHHLLTRLRAEGEPGRVAVEVRDAILWTPQLPALLRDCGAVPSYSVHPRVPPLAAQLTIAPPESFGHSVVRWMLHPTRRYEEARADYSPFDTIQAPDSTHRNQIARIVAAAAAAGRPATVIVNNKAEGSAPLSVHQLADEIGRLAGTGGSGNGAPSGRREGERARQDSNLGPSA